MLKQLLTIFSVLGAASALACADVNLATLAELDAIQGIGPALSQRIVGQRDKAAFADWSDLIDRVHGIGNASAARLSTQGLTVNGKFFPGSAPPAGEPSARCPKAD